MIEESRSAFKMLTGKPLGRPRRRWEDNIRMDFKEIGIREIGLSSCECHIKPPGSISHGSS